MPACLMTGGKIFGYRYGFNANAMSKFVTDFLDHSKTCSELWKEPPTSERAATTIRNQNMLVGWCAGV